MAGTEVSAASSTGMAHWILSRGLECLTQSEPFLLPSRIVQCCKLTSPVRDGSGLAVEPCVASQLRRTDLPTLGHSLPASSSCAMGSYAPGAAIFVSSHHPFFSAFPPASRLVIATTHAPTTYTLCTDDTLDITSHHLISESRSRRNGSNPGHTPHGRTPSSRAGGHCSNTC